MTISTHVLDAVSGTPADGVAVVLERREDDGWTLLMSAVTDADGRIADLAPDSVAGVYRLTFDVAGYFGRSGTESFYPEVAICFRVVDAGAHHHVPLLLSPFAYSTYRGS